MEKNVTTTQKNSIKTKNQLLTAGFRLFGEKGFYRSKLEDVAKIAGLSRGAIYWHFKDKMDFCKELMKKGVEIIGYDQLNSLNNGIDPKEKLTNLVTEQLDKYMFDKKYLSIAKVYYRFGVEIDDPKFIKESAELQTSIVKPAIINLINEGKEKGQIRKDLKDEEIYTVLATIMSGLAALVHGSSNIVVKKVDGEKVIKTMLEAIFLNNQA